MRAIVVEFLPNEPAAFMTTNQSMQFYIKASSLWPSDDEAASDPLTQVPAGMRRRLSSYAKLAFRAALSVMDKAEEPANLPVILASQHGDLQRTVLLLKDLAADEELSPTQFCLSVNNAVLGQLSMAVNNTSAMVTISSAEDSFAYAMLEAAAMLANQEVREVLVLYTDEPVPEDYQRFQQQPSQALSLALLLTATAEPGEAHLVQMERSPTAHQPGRTADESAITAVHQLVNDMHALSHGQRQSVQQVTPLNQWRWQLER